MLEFFKKMTGRTEEIVEEPGAFDVIGFSGRYLRFVCPHPVPLQRKFHIELDLPELGPTKVPLKVVSRSPHEDGTLHIAQVEADGKIIERMLLRFGHLDEEGARPPVPDWSDKRACPRYAVDGRVTSPALPHMEARLIGLSASGARLETHGAVDPETRLVLTVDFREPGVPPVELAGTVVWCSTSGPSGRGYWLGLKFGDLPASNRRALDDYLEQLRQRHQPSE